MSYETLSEILGQKNSPNFRYLFRGLVSGETRDRLDAEVLASRKEFVSPKFHRSPEKDPELRLLEERVESRKKQLKDTLAHLEGDLEIINSPP